MTDATLTLLLILAVVCLLFAGLGAWADAYCARRRPYIDRAPDDPRLRNAAQIARWRMKRRAGRSRGMA